MQLHLGAGTAGLLFLASTAFCYAEALIIPSLTYRTGPYQSSGVPYSDGFSDYFTFLNLRDGGINGKPIEVVECEYGYDTERGVACFEETLAKGALLYHPMSTGLTYKLMARAHEVGVVLHTMGYGLTAAADGASFPYAFNFPAHYWHGATAQIRHVKEIEGGSLRGRRIMHLYHNSGYGKEPITTFERLAEIEGFELLLQPIDHPGQDQSDVWPAVEAAKPDYIFLWGWGIMNRVALENAAKIGFPMDRIIGIWWSANEGDIKPLRRAGHGYKAVTFHAVGTSFPFYNEMNELVYQTMKSRGQQNNLGDVLYNRGVVSAVIAAAAIRKAMEIHDTTEVTRAMVRDGYEALYLGADELRALGIEGFIPPMELSCADHGGGRSRGGEAVGRQQPALGTDHRLLRAAVRADLAPGGECGGEVHGGRRNDARAPVREAGGSARGEPGDQHVRRRLHHVERRARNPWDRP